VIGARTRRRRMIKSFFKGNIGEGKPYQDIVRLNACAMAAHKTDESFVFT
jgi:hypothetical protein